MREIQMPRHRLPTRLHPSISATSTIDCVPLPKKTSMPAAMATTRATLTTTASRVRRICVQSSGIAMHCTKAMFGSPAAPTPAQSTTTGRKTTAALVDVNPCRPTAA